MKPDEIKRLRQRLRLSLLDMAAQLGVSPATVEAWEQGRRRPSQAAAVRLEKLANRASRRNA